MKPKAFIPVEEFKQRVANAAALVREWGLDALIVNGSEADYANTRYFSNFWPLFERCGVAIAANGDCALMVGPESEVFAQDKGVIDLPILLIRSFLSPPSKTFSRRSVLPIPKRSVLPLGLTPTSL